MLVLLVTALSSCSNQSTSILNEKILILEKQLEQYQQEISEQKDVIIELKQKLSENQAIIEGAPVRMKRAGGLCYIAFTDDEKVRFVGNKIGLRALPFEDSPNINAIQENSLIHVQDKVSNTGDYDNIETLWYYVSIPVYDSPIDYKGWVKCKETDPYDKNNKELVQSDVSIRIGAKYSGASELPNFNDDTQVQICNERIGGRITKRHGDYVYIEGIGGSIYWVHKDDIVYPDIP